MQSLIDWLKGAVGTYGDFDVYRVNDGASWSLETYKLVGKPISVCELSTAFTATFLTGSQHCQLDFYRERVQWIWKKTTIDLDNLHSYRFRNSFLEGHVAIINVDLLASNWSAQPCSKMEHFSFEDHSNIEQRTKFYEEFLNRRCRFKLWYYLNWCNIAMRMCFTNPKNFKNLFLLISE